MATTAGELASDFSRLLDCEAGMIARIQAGEILSPEEQLRWDCHMAENRVAALISVAALIPEGFIE